MNRENIKKLIEVLRHPLPNVAYDQNTYFSFDPHTMCGTTACLAGHAALLAETGGPDFFIRAMRRSMKKRHDGGSIYMTNRDFWEVGQAFLGLTFHQATDLFGVDDWNEEATPAQAIRALEYLLATGDVCWGLAMHEYFPIPPDPEEDEPEDEDYDDELIKLTEPA